MPSHLQKRLLPFALMAALILTINYALQSYRARHFDSSLPAEAEDFRQARSHFETHLLRHESAPQQGRLLDPAPAGATLVTYQQAPKLQAWLGMPLGSPPVMAHKSPAVLFLHGGFAMDISDWQMIEPYRRAGFVVMMPALRGENGQPGDFSVLYDEINDVLAASNYLARQPQVNPKNVFVSGHSVGGTMAQLAALSSPLFRAATSFSGSANQKVWLSLNKGLATFDVKDSREIAMRSPEAFAGSFLCPVRLYCGRGENWCIRPSRRTVARARAHGKDVSLTTVVGDHVSAVPEEMRLSIAFFQKFKE